jgi:CHAT domain-containing protein
LRTAAFSLLLFLPSSAISAQHTLWTEQTKLGRQQLLNPGVVVLDVQKGGDAEKAGLQEGDILLRWSRGDASGELELPFDVSWVDIEQRPRGQVTFEGVRGSTSQTWVLKRDGTWKLKTRPNLKGQLLVTYLNAYQLVKKKRFAQAARHWQSVANQVPPGQAKDLVAWLLYLSADAFTNARAWREAKTLYEESTRRAISVRNKTQLFWYWAYLPLGRSDFATAAKLFQRGEYLAEPGSLMTALLQKDAGWAAMMRSDWTSAEAYAKRALEIRQKLAPGSSEVASVFNVLGWLETERGDVDLAQDYYDRAIGILEQLAPNTFSLASAYQGRADLEYARGDWGRAEEDFLRVSTNSEEDGATRLAAAREVGLGSVAYGRGDFGAAEMRFRHALQVEQTIEPNSPHVANILDWLAGVAQYRGDLAATEQYAQKALKMQERAPSVLAHQEMAYSLLHLAQVYEARDDIPKAELVCKKALAIDERVAPHTLSTIDALLETATVARLRKDLPASMQYIRRALAISQSMAPSGPYTAWNFMRLGDIYRDLSRFEDARASYQNALDIFEKAAPDSEDHAESLAALGNVSRMNGRGEIAAQYYQRSLAALEGQTARLGGTSDVRAGFRAKHESYYHEYVDLLVAQNQPELAFDVLERSRARTLLETLAAAHVDVRQGADPKLVAKERSLQADMKAKFERRINLLSDKHRDEQLKAVEKEINDLTAEYEDIEAQIRSTSPSYAALTQPQPLSAKEIQQQLLDPDTLLLEYSLGEDRSYVFAVTPDSLQASELPRRAQIEDAARRANKMLTAPNHNSATATPVQKQARAQAEHRLQQALDELSRMILGPVTTQLAGKRLLIVPDGALDYIPFQALPEAQEEHSLEAQAALPLVARHEIVNLPSASVLAVLRQQQMNRPEAPMAVAVLADPVFAKDDPRLLHRDTSAATGSLPVNRSAKVARSRHDLDDLLDTSFSAGVLNRSAAEVGLTRGNRLELPRLRFSRQEANAILAVTPPGLGLEALDFRASRATATSPELSQYRIVHFATHGLLNSEHPELSGLVLSLVDAKGKPQEGFLELEDIYNLNLHADLVVLSACETGLGKEISGEGLVGLTRGFMYAGASRVVASLWKVSDVATAKLMAEFYRALEKDGLAPAAALRQAQVEMWKQPRWRSPYYWAAFQLQGEWK